MQQQLSALQQHRLATSTAFHTKIGPLLPIDLYARIQQAKTVTLIHEGHTHKVELNDQELIDITQYLPTCIPSLN